MSTQWNWRLLRAGSFRLDGGSMFGIIPKVMWSKLAAPDELNRIGLQTNCLLLDDGTRKVLIETGYGNKFDAKSREIYALEDRSIVEALGEAGVEAGEIDAVVVTHLHFDHAGGLTQIEQGKSSEAETSTAAARLTFPNAKVYVQRVEWEDALANKSTMTKTYLREHLEPVKAQVVLVEGEAEPVGGIRVIRAPGHTWGQQAVIFEDAEGMVIFGADVMPTANHVGLPFNMGYDQLPYQNVLTKRALFERCVAEGWRWAIDHEPGAAVVRIARRADRADAFELKAV